MNDLITKYPGRVAAFVLLLFIIALCWGPGQCDDYVAGECSDDGQSAWVISHPLGTTGDSVHYCDYHFRLADGGHRMQTGMSLRDGGYKVKRD